MTDLLALVYIQFEDYFCKSVDSTALYLTTEDGFFLPPNALVAECLIEGEVVRLKTESQGKANLTMRARQNKIPITKVKSPAPWERDEGRARSCSVFLMSTKPSCLKGKETLKVRLWLIKK